MIKAKLLKESSIKTIFYMAATFAIVSIAVICIFLFANGFPALREIGIFKFLFGTVWNPSDGKYGILTMIVGTAFVVGGSLIVAVPLSVLTAVFIAKFCTDKLKTFFKQAVSVLVGIPSIIYGFFGMIIIVPIAKEFAYVIGIKGASGSGIFVGSLVLGIMIAPTIINIAVTALENVPKIYYDGALALGSTKEEAVFKVILPAAKNGVVTGIILGVGRAMGETMALSLVLGNSAVFPNSIFHSMETLTVGIVKEMAYADGLHYQALISIGLVLFVFVLLLSVVVNALKSNRKKERRVKNVSKNKNAEKPAV